MSLDLRTLRDYLSLGQTAVAVLAVWLGGGGTPLAIVAAVGLTVLAFLRPLPEQAGLGSQRAWTVLVAVARAHSPHSPEPSSSRFTAFPTHPTCHVLNVSRLGDHGCQASAV